ncbi:hypothetical protein C2845_PM11G04930 [Panicum miliaceum]|uniref:HIRAN domain-containing protein n=1 Tax=Panicum miliaceum TaxID=4540 RepID=A0A3L6RNE0_PANMI|nr:hypothetical protein C2845_PM11G04930 [Panicum miliaceum]
MACDGADRRDPPELSSDQPAIFDDEMAAAVDALTRCIGDTERAIKWLQDNAAAANRDGGVVEPSSRGVKEERGDGGAALPPPPPPPVKVEAVGEVRVEVKTEPIHADPDEVKAKIEAPGEVDVKMEVEAPGEAEVKQEDEADEVDVKEEEEEPRGSPIKGQVLSPPRVKEDESDCSEDEVEMMEPPARSKKRPHEDDGVVFIDLTTSHPAPYLNPKPIRAMPPPGAIPKNEWGMVVAPPPAELDEYPPDRREWCFFKKSYATELSTCRGRKLLDGGEVVHFAFPSHDRLGGIRMSYRQAAALMEIVRFSTNRSGEIGKLSPVWVKCLAPLVNSSTIKVQGKIVFPMMELRLMQEVLLYASPPLLHYVFLPDAEFVGFCGFYVHRSSLFLIAPENVHHLDNPLRGLFKLLRRFGVPEV